MKIKHIIILFIIFNIPLLSAEEKDESRITHNNIIQQISENLKLPDAEFKGKLLHITAKKKQALFSFKGVKINSEALLKFSTKERGLVLKILFKNDGKQIWVYNTAGAELFNKTGDDRYDYMLNTNFSFIDFFLGSQLGFYAVSTNDNTVYKKQECHLLELVSAVKNPYGSFDMYIDKNDRMPLRIDFHDYRKIIFKSMTIVKINEYEKIKIPVRFDMLNIEEESLTILEYTEFKKIKEYNSEIFRYENLARDL